MRCQRVCSPFTLVELLEVLGVVALLAGLLLPTMARGKSKAQSSACSSNLKQLGVAVMLYLEDHEDTFPSGSPGSTMGAQPEDWIWWQVHHGIGIPPAMRDPRHSAIAPYLGGFNCNPGLHSHALVGPLWTKRSQRPANASRHCS